MKKAGFLKGGALALVVWGAAFSDTAEASRDLFESVTTSPNPALTPVIIQSNNLPGMIKDTVDRAGQLAKFAGNKSTTTFSYMGIPNAVRVTVDPTGNDVVLSIPSIGFKKKFTGTSPNDAQEQVVEYLKKNTDKVWTKFQEVAIAQSPIAVTDGNPGSTTAFLATQTYMRFATHADIRYSAESEKDINDQRKAEAEKAGKKFDDPVYKNAEFNVYTTAGTYDADGFDGNQYQVVPSFAWHFDDRVSLYFALPVQYTAVSGANIYSIAAEVAVPVKVFMQKPEGADEGSYVTWQLTPYVDAGGGASTDLISGAFMPAGGIASLVEYDMANWRFSLGTQFGYYKSVSFTVDNITVDPGVDQQIFKVGPKATYYIAKGFYLDAGVAYSRFLQNAAIPDYWTPFGGFGCNITRALDLNLGIRADVASGYNAKTVQFDATWRF
jgi:hypothetical protein